MKRMTMKFMALALLTFAGAASVFAQGVAFTSTSLPRQMRQDGLTETAGEVVITAINAGTVPSTATQGSTIDFVFSVPITSDDATGAAETSLANNITCAGPGFGIACPGSLVSATLTGTQTVRLRFLGAGGTAFQVGDQITLSRVRVNANAAVGVGSVTATLSGISQDPATFPISFTDPQRQVGVLNPTITVNFNHTSAPNGGVAPIFRTCAFPNDNADDFYIRITEVFPGALTRLADEQGFANTASLPVTNGSQVQITVSGVPAGYTLSQTNFYSSTFPAPPVGTNNFTAIGGTSFDQVTAGAPITFTYNVTTADISVVERITFGFSLKPTTTSTTNPLAVTAVGTPQNITASVSIVPISTAAGTIVRFVANQIGPTSVATISDCTTRILLTWVATVADVETGVAISNTSSDDAAFGAGALLGATSQNGTCTLTGYPSAGGTPVSFTTATINAGSSLAFLMSATTGFSNFTGYVLTVCNFEAAHAFAFITNGRGTVTGPTLAQGYVANIIQPGARPGIAGISESLGN